MATATDRTDARLLSSWIQIQPDNTIAIRTGVGEFGTGAVNTSFRQIVAEELRVPFHAVSELVTGDTDGNPEGGLSAGTMSRAVQELVHKGVGLHPDSPFGRSGLNLQKVAAYAYGALLERASQVLGAPVDALSADGGIVSSGSARVSYAELVRDSPLELPLEVAGDSGMHFGVIVLGSPPLVPVSEWRVLGTSAPSPRIPLVVQAATKGVGDMRLPGMLHARTVHPRTLGSTLVSVGALDADAYPGAQLVVRENLVAVVSPDEWEAVRAAEALAESTVWSDWHGLPRSDRLAEALLETDWSTVPAVESSPDREAVEAALASAPQTLNAFFTLPFYKHAPMSPEVAVADVRDDGGVQVWAATQQPQVLRQKIARMLETDVAAVVVHFVEGAGIFGRTTAGDAGPEAEAVILSQACGRPIRLQWTREEDFAWSTQHAPYLGEVTVGLDDAGRMTAVLADHHMPGSSEPRLLGALLAGLPTEPTQGPHTTTLWNEWPYDAVPHRVERAHGAENVGQPESPIHVGLRHRSMRSPVHLHQNFAVEAMVNEAAAAAGVDPIQYRIEHTTDGRLIAVLETVRRMSGWEERPSPAPSARAAGGGVVRGRGIGVAIRHGGYFAGVAEISVDLDGGVVSVERYWLAAEVGVVVNPKMLRLNLEGGSAMGISQALREELQFDSSAITSTDFRSYPILTMAEMPEIEVEIIDRPDVMVVGQGSEPPNMVPPVALTGAFFDATGQQMRRLPLRPEYVLAELRDT